MKKLVYLFICLVPAAGFAQQIDSATIAVASSLFDLQFTPAEKDSMQAGLKANLGAITKMHKLPLSNNQPYPFAFNPAPIGYSIPTKQLPVKWNIPQNVSLPTDRNELAFYSIPQ